MNEEIKETQKDVIPGYKSVQEFTQEGFKVLIEGIRNSNALPQDRSWDFYKTHESFRTIMNDEGSSILQMINAIIKEQGVLGNFASRDLDEKIEVIVEANDAILERAATNLDEVNGIRKNPDLGVKLQEVSAVLPVSGSWNKIENANLTVSSLQSENSSVQNPGNAIRLITANNIQRPQKFFKDRIDNGHKFPWEPRIKEKPNSLKPLAVFLEENEDGTQSYSHPYEFELEKFEPSPELLKSVEPKLPKNLEDTPLKMVETENDMNLMLEDLRKYNEIAIDLEHHSYRTFMGITCLMQISTGDTDYIIDTLTLRDKLCVLNEVFTKPSIVKVFHGADHDIEWLQRDLSLYIVNMFDTYQAAKQLGFDQRSLAFLLRKYCQIDANKHFQLADWRIRPLPDELKLYAREDTHYLLYIYQKMRNELLALGNNNPHILKSVIHQSTEVCKKRFEKPLLTENSHLILYRKYKKLFDNKQMYALKELYKWRDSLARTEDESTGYVLPNHMLLQIAEVLPREMQGILACCNPIPPLVRANLLEIHKIILKAREQSLIKPILAEEPRVLGSVQTVTRLNVENALNCPHDITNIEFRDDLPTLLGDILKKKQKTDTVQAEITEKVILESSQPKIDIFEKIEASLRSLENATKKVNKLRFLGPFERYKLVKPFMQAEEEKKEAFLAKEKIPESRIGDNMELKASAEVLEDKIALEEDTERIVTKENDGMISVKINNTDKVQKNKVQKTADIIPLRQMGGCKRKRSLSPAEHSENITNPEETPPIEDTVAPLLNVTPNQDSWTNKNQYNNRKRKNKNQHSPQSKRSRNNSYNSNEKRSYNDNPDGQFHPRNLHNKDNRERQRDTNTNQYKNRNMNQHNRNEQYHKRQDRYQQDRSQPHKDRQQRNQNQSHNSQQQNSRSYEPFDYSAVDFKQFQGGASGVNQNSNVRSNFRGKNKSKIRGRGVGKSNNRSQFFGTNNSSRGKGRR